MKTFNLTSRELLYLAAENGAKEFLGVSDGFYGLDEAEIIAEINQVKLALNHKGYAEIDFDGGFNVYPEVVKMLKVCTECEKYLTIDQAHQGKSSFIRCYTKENLIYFMTEQNKLLQIRLVSKAEMQEGILNFINWPEINQLNSGKVILESSFLQQIKQMNELDNPENKLELKGCDKLQAQIIYAGLTGKAAYYSLLLLDFLAESDPGQSLMFIDSPEGLLELKLQDIASQSLEISFIASEQALEKIKAILKEIVPERKEHFE